MQLTTYHAKFYAYDILRKTRNDISATIFNAKVQMNPHQILAAQYALRSPLTKGVILADEVGLGKTIEAGLILAQLWAERKTRLLIVCPAVLRKQWQEELKDKFALKSVILDSKPINDSYKKGEDLFNLKEPCVLICSYHFLNNHKYQNKLKAIKFDLVVFDEAHKLKNEGSIIYGSVSNTFQHTKKILLTATPLQNNLSELYGLVNIIDDKFFSSKRILQGNLSDTDIHQLRERLKIICNRTLRKDVVSFIRYTDRYSKTFNYQSTHFELQLFNELNNLILDELSIVYDKKVIYLIRVALLKIKSSSSIAIYDTLKKIKFRIESNLNDTNSITNLEDIDNEILADSDEDIDDVEYQNIDTNSESVEIINKQGVLLKLNEIINKLEILINNEQDSKLPNLLKAIKFGFDKMKEIEAKEKCVIFTESVVTQNYLKKYLEQNGFADKIVLFNASNNDDKSKQIYNDWLIVKANRNKISGVKSADMKLAIIDYFEKSAKILIATDSASEGVNLQFCSLLINYDLPWNPQRIEQRIGRVHRYGQKHDVVVINFVDTNNLIDKRIYEVLDKKFCLFDGVFGSSNEILGSIANLNNGFERLIQDIFKNCRDEASINQGFDLLTEQFKEENSQKVETAKQILNSYFDEDVQNLLQESELQNKTRLDQISQKLWELTKYQLSKLVDRVEFNEEDKTIQLQQQINGIRVGTYYMIKKDDWEQQKDYSNNQLYRLNHPLGELVINAAKNGITYDANNIAFLQFNLSGYSKMVNALEPYKNHEGYLTLERLVVDTNGYVEDYLIFTGILNNGVELTQQDCERLFNLDAIELTAIEATQTQQLNNQLTKLQEFNKNKTLLQFEEQKAKNFEEEYIKIECYRNDILDDFNDKIKEIDNQTIAINKQMKQVANTSGKVKLLEDINKLRAQKRNLEDAKQNKEDELNTEAKALVKEYQNKLEPNINVINLFIIKFKII